MEKARLAIAQVIVVCGMLVAIIGLLVAAFHVFKQGRDPFGYAEVACSYQGDDNAWYRCVNTEQHVTPVERGLQYLPIPALGALAVAIGTWLWPKAPTRFLSPTGAVLTLAALHLQVWLMLWYWIAAREAEGQAVAAIAVGIVLFALALRWHARVLGIPWQAGLAPVLLLQSSRAAAAAAGILAVGLLPLGPAVPVFLLVTPAAGIALPAMLGAIALRRPGAWPPQGSRGG